MNALRKWSFRVKPVSYTHLVSIFLPIPEVMPTAVSFARLFIFQIFGIGFIELFNSLFQVMGQWKIATVSIFIAKKMCIRDSYYPVQDPNTGAVTYVPYTYTVQVPYTYYTCTVELENFNLSHVPVYIMSEEQLSMYAMYMSVIGNRPDLFAGYPNASALQEYTDYEIPPEALEDEQFAAMITEAERYLGFPYVWGGRSPSTSFDCSGLDVYKRQGRCRRQHKRYGASANHAQYVPHRRAGSVPLFMGLACAQRFIR